MNRKTFIIFGVLAAFCLMALLIKKSVYNYNGKPYAEIRLSEDGQYQVLIVAIKWAGLFKDFGYEGYQTYLYGYTTLDGKSTIYTNPPFIELGFGVRHPYYGTVSVDLKTKSVSIALTSLTSTNFGTNHFENCLLNGTYQIKDINKNPFY